MGVEVGGKTLLHAEFYHGLLFREEASRASSKMFWRPVSPPKLRSALCCGSDQIKGAKPCHEEHGQRYVLPNMPMLERLAEHRMLLQSKPGSVT